MNSNVYGVAFCSDENVLKLDCSDVCTNYLTVHSKQVNFVAFEIYLKKTLKRKKRTYYLTGSFDQVKDKKKRHTHHGL